MLFSSLKKKELQNDINILEEKKISLEKDIKKMQEQEKQLEIQINDTLKQQNKLNTQIKNRENLFIEHELILIDTLTGLEFEDYFAKILTKLGYSATVTKASGDDGGDIIAIKDNTKIVFQCKNYSEPVGNKAVQEVYTAKDIYKCQKAIVITNNYFTKQAKKEAEILLVELWDRDILLKLLCKTFEFDINNIDKKIYRTNQTNLNKSIEIEEQDPMLNEAIQLIIDYGQVSTAFIQRRLRIGYARAGRILEQLEEIGVIGSSKRK